MNHRLGFLALLSATALLACGVDQQIGGEGGHGTGGTDTTTTTSNSTTTSAGGCPTTSVSTLQGVSIEITATNCTLSLSNPGQGLALDYEVVINADVTGVRPIALDAGKCDKPGPSGLVTSVLIAGGTEEYCLCDNGLCLGDDLPLATLAQGTYPSTFAWSGHNWNGPSDTLEPEGPLFIVGEYTYTVNATGTVMTANGEVPFAIDAKMPIHVVP